MKKLLLPALCLAVLLIGWRPVPKEPEGLGLVRVLGVDGSGPVVLTAVCGGDGPEQAPVRGQSAGGDFQRALEELPWSGQGEELSLTSVSYLVAGRDADLEGVLLAVLRDEELGASATVWLADRGEAVLSAWEDPAGRLDLLTRQEVGAPTAAQALAALRSGSGLFLPVLSENGFSGWEKWRER